VTHEWTKKTLEALNHYRPAEYPLFKEQKRFARRDLEETNTFGDFVEEFGVENGVMTTVHAYTNDQQGLDNPHSHVQRALHDELPGARGQGRARRSASIALRTNAGQTLVTSDGATLLGADDKAGVATITATLEFFANDIVEKIRGGLPHLPLVTRGSSSIPPELVEIVNRYGGKMLNAIGVPMESIQQAAKMGVTKVNIDSDNRIAVTGVMTTVHAYANDQDAVDQQHGKEPPCRVSACTAKTYATIANGHISAGGKGDGADAYPESCIRHFVGSGADDKAGVAEPMIMVGRLKPASQAVETTMHPAAPIGIAVLSMVWTGLLRTQASNKRHTVRMAWCTTVVLRASECRRPSSTCTTTRTCARAVGQGLRLHPQPLRGHRLHGRFPLRLVPWRAANERFEPFRKMNRHDLVGMLLSLLKAPVFHDGSTPLFRWKARLHEAFDIWYEGLKVRSRCPKNEAVQVEGAFARKAVQHPRRSGGAPMFFRGWEETGRTRMAGQACNGSYFKDYPAVRRIVLFVTPCRILAALRFARALTDVSERRDDLNAFHRQSQKKKFDARLMASCAQSAANAGRDGNGVRVEGPGGGRK